MNQAASLFDAAAKRYDRAYDARSADGHALRARMDAVVRLIGDGPGALLDAGMGPGRLCAELARRGWTVSGVDGAEEMVAAARIRLPEAADRLVVADVEHLPFADASFDAVVATGVLEYVRVPVALGELARVLRPDGRAMVSYPNPYALYGVWKSRVFYPAVRVGKRLLRRRGLGLPHGAGAIGPRRFEAMLREAGLRVEHVEYTSVLPLLSPLDEALPRVAARLAERLEGRRRLGPALGTQVLFAARRR